MWISVTSRVKEGIKMGDFGFGIKKDKTNNVTCEIITQNSECRQSLKSLTKNAIKQHVSFVNDDGVKFLIGFHGREALWASISHLNNVLSGFSEEAKADFYNAF